MHEQVDHIWSSMDCQLGDHGFFFLWIYIKGRSSLNGMFDKPGYRIELFSCLQTNLDSVYSIMMIASMSGWIVQMHDASIHSINTLVHHVEWWYGLPLDAHLDHLLLVLMALWTVALIFLLCSTCGSPFIWALRNIKFQQDNA